MATDDAGVDSARALLVGREISAVCFVRDYIELHLDGPVVRALTRPFGTWSARHTSWQYPEADSFPAMLSLIGRTVDDFTLVVNEYAQLAIGEDAFNVPLKDEDRIGPEALHLVGVDDAGNTSVLRGMWIW